jgi:hypothetical protein
MESYRNMRIGKNNISVIANILSLRILILPALVLLCFRLGSGRALLDGAGFCGFEQPAPIITNAAPIEHKVRNFFIK